MLGLTGYGSDSSDESARVSSAQQRAHGVVTDVSSTPEHPPIALLGLTQDSEEASSDGSEEERIQEEERRNASIARHSAALLEMKERLDFSRLCNPCLPAGTTAAVTAEAPTLALECLLAEKKDPTEFIKNHHDFINPERTQSVLEKVEVRLQTYHSHIPSRSKRLRKLEEIPDFAGRMKKSLKEEAEREAKRRRLSASSGVNGSQGGGGGGGGGASSSQPGSLVRVSSTASSSSASPPPPTLLRRRSSVVK